MIRAAASFVSQGLGTAVLVGREDRVEAAATFAGVELRDGSRSRTPACRRAPTPMRNSLRAAAAQGLSDARLRPPASTDRNHFAACMVAMGDADAMVTGLTRNYSIALEDIRRVVDHKPGHRVIGVSIAIARGRTVLVADTAVHDMPTSEELAEIAIEAASVARRLGYEPRVAMLAYLDLRPSARASGPSGCARRCASSTSSASTSNMTARWPPTSR